MSKEKQNAKQMPKVYYCKHIEKGLVKYQDGMVYIGDEALKKMSSQQIPHLLTNNKNDFSELFNDLSRIVQKKIDQSSSVEITKKLNQLHAKVAKLKMDFK